MASYNSDDSDSTRRSRWFIRVWRAMEEDGQTDGLGGSEYRRVRAEWIAAGRPADVREFIRRRANVGPEE